MVEEILCPRVSGTVSIGWRFWNYWDTFGDRPGIENIFILKRLLIDEVFRKEQNFVPRKIQK